MNNFDKYLDPPDEPEAVYCKYCGQEMRVLEEYAPLGENRSYYAVCENSFCPENFTGDVKEMAEKLVEALDTVSSLEVMVKYLSNRLKQIDPEWK